jgi:MYXO-CTERM domain-containing protein
MKKQNKNWKKLILALMVFLASTFFTSLNAQQSQQVNDRTNYSSNSTPDDGRISPWWGLLGLVGLFGLMRRSHTDNYEERTRTASRN